MEQKSILTLSSHRTGVITHMSMRWRHSNIRPSAVFMEADRSAETSEDRVLITELHAENTKIQTADSAGTHKVTHSVKNKRKLKTNFSKMFLRRHLHVSSWQKHRKQHQNTTEVIRNRPRWSNILEPERLKGDGRFGLHTRDASMVA